MNDYFNFLASDYDMPLHKDGVRGAVEHQEHGARILLPHDQRCSAVPDTAILSFLQWRLNNSTTIEIL